jgi:hypothetical protein
MELLHLRTIARLLGELEARLEGVHEQACG